MKYFMEIGGQFGIQVTLYAVNKKDAVQEAEKYLNKEKGKYEARVISLKTGRTIKKFIKK